MLFFSIIGRMFELPKKMTCIIEARQVVIVYIYSSINPFYCMC